MSKVQDSPAGYEIFRQVIFCNFTQKIKATAAILTVVFLGCCRQCLDTSSGSALATDEPFCVIDTKYPVWFFQPPVLLPVSTTIRSLHCLMQNQGRRLSLNAVFRKIPLL